MDSESKTTTILEMALQYAAMGWHVFPCQPRSKIPYPGTRGVKDATTDQDVIRAWFTRWPDANIALACGVGDVPIYVVDVDVDNEKGINGFESLEEFQDVLPRPQTLTQDTPRKGAHFLFTSSTPAMNRNNFRKGIDIRGRGYYIVLAPSIHPNGKAYKWRNWGAELAQFPDAMRPQKEARPWEVTQINPLPVRKSTIKRASEYLASIDPAVQGQGGHDTLLRAAAAMVVRFGLDDNTALSLLWNEYNPRCIPPWDMSKPSDVKDFERKVREARKTARHQFGDLRDAEEYTENTSDIEYGAEIAASLIASADKPVAPVEVVEQVKRPKALAKRPKAGEYPDYLLNPPGMVGDLCKWINATAGCPQPLLALGASIVACGALFGRKVRDMSNGRTNIYMMGVAHSSAGKDHPYDCVQRLFNAAGASLLLGGRITSDSAIEVALMEHPTKLLGIDEVGHFFTSIKMANGAANPHLKSIVPMLMELFSSAHKLYIGKQRAMGEARRIDQPHVCVWGNSSPDIFYSGISRAELRDGWLGRVVTLISESRPKYEIVEHSEPPEALIQLVQAWVQRKPPPPDNGGDIMRATTTHQIVVPTSPEAMAVFNAFRDEAYGQMLACEKADDDTQFLWGKALQQARTIALIIASGESFELPEISGSTAKYACDLMRLTTQNFSRAIAANVADTQWESEKQKIYKLIQKCGATGIPKTNLTRKTQWIKDRHARNAYIEDLVEAGKIIHGEHKEHPEARGGWLWALPYGLDLLKNEKKGRKE